MAKKVKCPHCSQTFDRDKEEFVQIKNRYFHKACYEELEKSKSVEEASLRELEKYIMKLFNEEFISAKVRTQIKQMRDRYNYSYSGILKTLIYYFEVKKGSLEKANNGIGIVPYVYKDAYEYYLNIYNAQKKNKDKDITTCVSKGRKIHIKPPVRKLKKIKLFDLGED